MTEENGKKIIHCPHCGVPLKKEDISVIMFDKATILACPACKKSLALQPRDF